MKATTSIDKTSITHSLEANLNGRGNNTALQDSESPAQTENKVENRGKPESELRAAARSKGLTLKELAALMGVNYKHLCSVANGRRPWTADLREKVAAVLGETPGQGVVYRQGGLVQGESSVIRERAREKGLNLKDLAGLAGVSYSHMTDVCRGRRNMSPAMQARVESALGGPVEIAPSQRLTRRHGPVKGETNWIRERARELGMSMRELAERVGVSLTYISQVARGLRNMGPAVQARMEAILGGPARIEAAQRPTVDPRVLWDRMEAHGLSQNEVARRVGISTAHLSHIMNGQRTPSGKVLRRLYEVLFRPSAAELVVPAEVKVMGWKKDERQGVVVKGAGGPHSGSTPGGGTVRIGGRVPWGARVEYAYTSGYDSRGRLSVNRIVDERGYGVMLKRSEPGGV